MEQSPLISVIIPAVNEAAALPATIGRLRMQSVTHEIILSVAPSYDGTASIAKEHGAVVVECDRRHRARQMNAGAAVARGNILLFLHADTLIPPGAFENIVHALSDAGVNGGAFARRYDARSRFLRFTCFLAEWRGKNFGIFLGDQAIFVRREIFDGLGGFKEIEIFEDFDLSRRLRRAGRTAMLRPPVLSAARRFSQAGPLMTMCRDLILTCQYLVGKPPNDLALKLPRRGTRLKRWRFGGNITARPRPRSIV
jgi:rSAM/selenodomain-associated transferase 2